MKSKTPIQIRARVADLINAAAEQGDADAVRMVAHVKAGGRIDFEPYPRLVGALETAARKLEAADASWRDVVRYLRNPASGAYFVRSWTRWSCK